MAIRAVLDTNVVLAAGGSSNTNSPNREIVHRWLAGEFTLLVTDDIIAEYAENWPPTENQRRSALSFCPAFSFYPRP